MKTKNFYRTMIVTLFVIVVLVTVLSTVIVVNERAAQSILSISPSPVQISMADTLPKACQMITIRVAPTVESPSFEVRECR